MPHSAKPTFGGQAVIEGVMMKSPSFITVAVRKADGSIKTTEEPFKSLSKKYKLLGLPLIRGVVNLFEMMVVGIRALNFSASEFAEETTDSRLRGNDTANSLLKKRQAAVAAFATMFLSVILSISLAIFLFKFTPLAITTWLQTFFPSISKNYVLFNSIDGVIRIIIFIAYILILSLFKSFRRIFEYHGAEHMSFFAHEKGHELTVANVKKECPRHPRCGTSFIMIVLILSIIILSFVPKHPDFLLNFLRRLSIVPLIAGVSYEVLKITAKYSHSSLARALSYPGILTQYITTKQPDEKQIEVAIAALKKAVELEKA